MRLQSPVSLLPARRPRGRGKGAIALSIRQPWAWAVLYAGKRVENRSWHTTYRGLVYLHAGLVVDYHAVDELAEVIGQVPAPRPVAYCGALIGVATLSDCVRPNDVADDQIPWASGPWCFVLEGVHALACPVPLRGQLGLFGVDPTAELQALAGLTKYQSVARFEANPLTL